MHRGRSIAPMVKLLDGRVLIIGGATHPGTTNTTEVYDPATGQWTQVGSMQISTEGASAVLLDDGKVLKVGAAGGFSSPVNSVVAELFDPATGQWTQTGSLHVARYATSLTKLQDGRVLMTAGNQWGPALTESEIYDPATGQWTVTGSTNFARISRTILMSDGRVLAAGGDDSVTGPILPTEIYDPATGTWTVDASLNVGHNPTDLVALPGNQYLVAGGFWTNTAEVYQGPVEQTITFDAIADTYVKDGHNDRNVGGGEFMRVRDSGNNRSLVRFDQNALTSAVGNGTVLSATLRLTIVDNSNNWGSTGRTVDVHRLLNDWAEGNGTEDDRGTGSGATWACAADANIANQEQDCSGPTEWIMGQPNNIPAHPWASAPTDTKTITNGLSGVVEYNVTADVAAFADGSADNFGWLIRKTLEGQSGSVSFGTKESQYVAQLVVTYQP
jgi:hypothetical protein